MSRVMEIITITIEQDGDNKRIGMNHSSAVTPDIGIAACEFIAGIFREQAIEAEVERRLAEKDGDAIIGAIQEAVE